MNKAALSLVAIIFAAMPTAAAASDSAFALWLNPSVSYDLNEDTAIELETAQRFRSEADGRADTYFGRLWLNQKLAGGLTLSGAFERRINNDAADETRTMQQLSLREGVLRGRVRLEQRFVDDADRLGLRLRPRLGVEVPLDPEGQWSFGTDAELFFTLRSNNRGGSNGLTGLRTQIAVSRDISDRLSVSAGYLRQQDIDRDGPDTIGHAPIFGLEVFF